MAQKDLSITTLDKRLNDTFGDSVRVMHSDDNAEKQVIRIRVAGLEDEDPAEHVALLKEFEQALFKDMPIKGFPEISKVTFTKHVESSYDSRGKCVTSDDNWVLETDGVCLRKILGVDKVDHRATVSNDCLEIADVLGIEAARQSLINELRFVLSSYGIYVNFRHLSTLTDIMAHGGKLMSIARHGINRIDSGALRKCSFEETVEILLEAAVHSERDGLRGITENIIMGQLAPMGTGAFEVKIDAPQLVSELAAVPERKGFGQAGLDSPGENAFLELVDGDITPMLAGSDRYNVPDHNVGDATSAYGMSARTPGSAHPTAFTPVNVYGGGGYESPNVYSSPAHYYNQKASPGYGSPGGMASPIYNVGGPVSPDVTSGGGYASPIYAQGMNLPQGLSNVQSPAYSPNHAN